MTQPILYESHEWPDKCLRNREVYVFKLPGAATDQREKGLTEFDLVTELKN